MFCSSLVWFTLVFFLFGFFFTYKHPSVSLGQHLYFFSHVFLQVNVRVTTMDAELEFAIQPSTTGKQLFDQVKCISPLYLTVASVLAF